MKETAAKRRDKAGGRDRDSKAEKSKDSGPEAQDVEMPEEEATNAAKQPREQDSLTLEDIKEHVKQIEKAVSGKEPRFVLRALRALPSTSRRLNAVVLHKAVSGFFTNNAVTRDFLLGFLEEPMEMADGDVQFRPRTGKAASAPLLPEVEAYLQLLLVVHLTNNKRFTEFNQVLDQFGEKFQTDGTYTLIIRLRHNVIKTGEPPTGHALSDIKQERREREQQDLEFAKEMAEDDDDSFP
ncbi:hypothetical protein F2P81_025481 [Scophthalmus maximus]|uniref:26S proteasome non-ATPase regulatory subunit 3 N-terminal TPR repeats domain-containing protein n=1 Tax=Scophthalmus maximus TaxID=52904 RepID=A0A6A4RPZ7_SCOMX|nr:hypothetical protein F2P81_025481 [Scophthalmus maximus]